jgi:pyruvate/2-oxoglutarate dehydrogenase complex dihydrolipoamide dehydrogenase (E3) component
MREHATETADTWDVVVIGGGPAGENAARYAIQGSERTAVIVEAELVGGECSYWACTPSKALLHPVELFEESRSMPAVAKALTGSIDVAATLARRDAFTHDRNDFGQIEWASGFGIDVVRGRARLVGERAVEVTTSDGSTRTVSARHAVVIATGTAASIPPIEGLREAHPWTSRDVTNLREVPRRVAVIGGGPVGCESTTWLRGLGAGEVTIIEPESSLLAKLEPFAGSLIAEAFASQGVTVLLETELASVGRPAADDTGIGRIHGGPAVVSTATSTLEVDEVVVGAGRTPRTDHLGLENIGVRVNDHGYIDTDDQMAVANADTWLYAIGDVCGRALLTHMGKYQGRIAGSVIAARAERRPADGPRYRDLADHGIVPAVVFTEPQVASVGVTESEAKDKGIDVEGLEYDLASIAGAKLLRDDYKGHAKVVVDRATDALVGATFVGDDVAELLHSATIAIVGKVPLETLWHAVPSFPTISEVWLRLLESRA